MKQLLQTTISILFFYNTFNITFGQTVTTLAGSGNWGTTDGTGSAALFASPTGVAVDGAGNVYVSDYGTDLIRKVTQQGIVTTIAGTGSVGSSNGIGTAASFDAPFSLTVDGSGNLYVADTDNHEIRKITKAGVVSTFAGNLYYGNTNATGQAASFDYPYGVAVDTIAGIIYVADRINNEIRKITTLGVVTTLAGSYYPGSINGTGVGAKFYSPFGVTVDPFGNVFVADTYNHQIRKITSAGVVTTFAGSGLQGNSDGIGSVASFNYPSSVASDASGNIYVADTNNNSIRKISTSGVVSTLAGNIQSGHADGIGVLASFNGPSGVACDALGNVYVADSNNNRIRKITTSSIPTGILGLTSIQEISVYPIPANDQLTVAFTLENESDLKLELINIDGNRVSTVEANNISGNYKLLVNIQSLSAGLYIANICVNGLMTSKKLLIAK